MEIKIKYFSDEIERLEYIGGSKSDWIDLRVAKDVELKAGEFALIPLGVAMELPNGYEAHVVPRSSPFKNFGIIQHLQCEIQRFVSMTAFVSFALLSISQSFPFVKSRN